jgi:protocatechuate 3,4-dioxygenase beta subunit
MKTKILTINNILLVFFLASCSSAAIPASAQVSTSVVSANTQVSPTTAPSRTKPSSSTAPAPAQAPQTGQVQARVCTAPASLTPALTEGPYFKANSPEQTSLLVPGVSGTKLTLTGFVLTANCQPIAHALLDFWQANAQGQYDNSGFTLRGHQYTDAKGYYHLETIVPGLYPGRTEHIHVKVQAPNSAILTTQLFFPGTSENQSDSIYDPRLLMTIKSSSAGEQATYNFIINANKGFY